MVGLRFWSRWSSAPRVLVTVLGVLAFGHMAVAGHWEVWDSQGASGPDFEYKIEVFKMVYNPQTADYDPIWVEDQDYDYLGEFQGMYIWEVGPRSYYFPNNAPVKCRLYYRYLGVEWNYMGEVNGEWVEQ